MGKGSGSVGIVASYDNQGGIFTGCGGAGANVGLGVGVSMGLVFTTDVNNISGFSGGLDFDIDASVGLAASVQIALDGTVGIEGGFGAGAGVNILTASGCGTSVFDVKPKP